MNTDTWNEAYEKELIEFASSCVRARSYSDEEGELAVLLLVRMKELGFDDIKLDSAGNVVGRVGNGERILQLDSHMDTVEVHDESLWEVPPFEGRISDGFLWGRGSVDMKSALSASVYAAAWAKRCGYLEGKTVYVTGTVCEEYCDGENLKVLYSELNLKPDACIICEPSNNKIVLGHKGKAQVRITTHGVSAHGSAPEKGVNAVYEMAEIIRRVEALNQKLLSGPEPRGTIVLSDISSVSASLNAVPEACTIYLDRRLAFGENLDQVKREMDGLIQGKNAVWEVGTLRRRSWNDAELVYEPMHQPWKIEPDHPLTKKLGRAYEEALGRACGEYEFWDFGTNAVTPVGMGIPTIGFGPGDYKLAHMTNERCPVGQIIDAFKVYAKMIELF